MQKLIALVVLIAGCSGGTSSSDSPVSEATAAPLDKSHFSTMLAQHEEAVADDKRFRTAGGFSVGWSTFTMSVDESTTGVDVANEFSSIETGITVEMKDTVQELATKSISGNQEEKAKKDGWTVVVQVSQAEHLARVSFGMSAVVDYRNAKALPPLVRPLRSPETPATAPSPLSESSEQYQHDADIFRARHIIEWAEIIEAYHATAGHYPLQARADGDKVVLVQIATREQQKYIDPENPKYVRALDNKNAEFTAVSVKDFVTEIEGVLKRDIDERYDPQRVPNGAPAYLSYFVSKDGYLVWAVSRTCPPRSNSFSTLLWTGTPSINIGSSWFIENIPKVQSISSLRANKEFVTFVGGGPANAGWFEHLEREQVDESKK